MPASTAASIDEASALAVRILEVDEDHIGIRIDDPPQQVLHVAHDHHIVVAGLAQALLEHRGSHQVLVDEQDPQRLGWHATLS
jgi:hypothetical protein